MKLIKYLVLAFVLSGSVASAQSFRFKTTSLTISEKNGKKWGKWSKPVKAEMVVELDYDKNRIVFYSKDVQYYRILEYLPKESKNGDDINSYICKSHEGMPAKVSFMVRKKEGFKTQVYIHFKYSVYCYDIVEITNEK